MSEDPDPLPPCRSQIIAALEELLGAVEGLSPGVVEVEPDSMIDIDRDILPRARLFDQGQQPQADFCGEDAYTLNIDIEIYARGESQRAALDLALLLRARAEKAILADITLGGLVRNLQFDTETAPLRSPMANQGFCRGSAVRLLIDYATREGDPFAFA